MMRADKDQIRVATQIFSVIGMFLLSAMAFAGGDVPSGLGSITGKMEQIRSLCRVCAGIIVGIGAIWSGVKFIKGDQDSWGYIWKFGLGAVLVFAAGDIVTWLGGSGRA